MARQRFIWPSVWKDPVFGKLAPLEQVMFIGLFSIADDDGRTLAEPAYLRSELFPYTDMSNKKVQAVRDSVVAKMASVCLYAVEGLEYIALLKWGEYQHPKYRKPSKLPSPPTISETSVPPTLGEEGVDAGSQGLGLDCGLDRDGQGLGFNRPADLAGEDMEERKREVVRMLVHLDDTDEKSEATLMHYALRLPAGAVAKVRESVSIAAGRGQRKGAGWAVNALKSELEARAA